MVYQDKFLENFITWPFIKFIAFLKKTIETQSEKKIEALAAMNITYGNVTYNEEYF